jgi:hypothetical protein
MSVVPVLPIVRKLIGDACCTILQNKFQNHQVAEPETARDAVMTSSALNVMAAVGQADLKSAWSNNVVGRVGSLGSAASVLFSGVKSAPPAVATSPAAKLPDVRNQPSASVTQALRGKGVLVAGTERVRADNVVEMVRAPAALKPGDRILLITDDNDNVVGYRNVPAPLSAADFQEALALRDQQLTQIQTRIAEAETAHTGALLQRDQQIAELQAELLKVQSVREELAVRDQQIAQLGTQVTELHKLVGATRPIR